MDSRGGRPTKGESENDAEGHGVNTENLADTRDAGKNGKHREKENRREELKDETTKRNRTDIVQEGK